MVVAGGVHRRWAKGTEGNDREVAVQSPRAAGS